MLLTMTSRIFTMAAETYSREIGFQELHKLVKRKQVFLVDVREPRELQETGKIPNSVNIPMQELAISLQLQPEEFRSRYNHEPPKPDGDGMVFSCRSGRRSEAALEIAQDLGFEKARFYKGSFNDWKAQRGPIEQVK